MLMRRNIIGATAVASLSSPLGRLWGEGTQATSSTHFPSSSTTAATYSHHQSVSIATTTQGRFIKVHTHVRQERNKSMVRDQIKYSRKWHLVPGQNNELVEEKGHEREAFENFFRYRTDWGMMKLPLYVSDFKLLQPKQRYDLLYSIINERKGLSAYMKNKYLLEAMECFIDMKKTGDVPPKFDDWKALDQNHLLYLCDEIMKNAPAYAKVQHSAVASVIRAAAICDELGCAEKRDMCLNSAEHLASRLDSHFAHKRQGEKLMLQAPWHDPNLMRRMTLQLEEKRLFPNKPEKHDPTPGKMRFLPRHAPFRLNAYPYEPSERKRPIYLKPEMVKTRQMQ